MGKVKADGGTSDWGKDVCGGVCLTCVTGMRRGEEEKLEERWKGGVKKDQVTGKCLLKYLRRLLIKKTSIATVN